MHSSVCLKCLSREISVLFAARIKLARFQLRDTLFRFKIQVIFIIPSTLPLRKIILVVSAILRIFDLEYVKEA